MALTPRSTAPVMSEMEGRRWDGVRTGCRWWKDDGGGGEEEKDDGGGGEEEGGGGGGVGCGSSGSGGGITRPPDARLKDGLRMPSSSFIKGRLELDAAGELSSRFVSVARTHTRLPPGLGCGVAAGLPFGVERGDGVGSGNSSDSESESALAENGGLGEERECFVGKGDKREGEDRDEKDDFLGSGAMCRCGFAGSEDVDAAEASRSCVWCSQGIGKPE